MMDTTNTWPAAAVGGQGMPPARAVLPPSITRAEECERDKYTGPASDLIAAGLVRLDQFPPANRRGISYLAGKPVRGNHRTDETYLRVERIDDETARVYIGVSREVAAARKAAADKIRRKERAAQDQKDKSEAAFKARRALNYTPNTEDEYRRGLAKQIRRWLRIALDSEEKPSSTHGFQLTRESFEAVLVASEGISEAILAAQVHFDAARHAEILAGYTATIKSADPSFYAQLDRLTTLDASILEGEAS